MPKLNFKYCDCGCKCLQADVYHIYWDLKTKYYLWEGRFRDNPKTFTSMDKAMKEAQRRFDAKNQRELN